MTEEMLVSKEVSPSLLDAGSVVSSSVARLRLVMKPAGVSKSPCTWMLVLALIVNLHLPLPLPRAPINPKLVLPFSRSDAEMDIERPAERFSVTSLSPDCPASSKPLIVIAAWALPSLALPTESLLPRQQLILTRE